MSRLDLVICPHCGHQGAMYYKDTVTGDELILQVMRWKEQVLYKDVFKHINSKKLPKTMAKQQEPGQKDMAKNLPVPSQKRPVKKTEQEQVRIKPVQRR
jgi:hypothetical protein